MYTCISNLIKKISEELDLFFYPEAGEKAQPEVKSAIERFHTLPYTERRKHPLLFWLLGESTQDYKITKEDSQYVEVSRTPEQYCKNCLFGYIQLARKNIICSQIQGYIKADGWCNRWKQADLVEETIYQSEEMKEELL